jgi:hypothetical protein
LPTRAWVRRTLSPLVWHDQQREIVDRLQRALLAASPTERQTLRALLDTFSRRIDLDQDVGVTVRTVRSATAVANRARNR